jgi:hypothetical protein
MVLMVLQLASTYVYITRVSHRRIWRFAGRLRILLEYLLEVLQASLVSSGFCGRSFVPSHLANNDDVRATCTSTQTTPRPPTSTRAAPDTSSLRDLWYCQTLLINTVYSHPTCLHLVYRDRGYIAGRGPRRAAISLASLRKHDTNTALV